MFTQDTSVCLATRLLPQHFTLKIKKKYFIGKSFIFHDYMKHDPDLPALIYFDFVNNEEQ